MELRDWSTVCLCFVLCVWSQGALSQQTPFRPYQPGVIPVPTPGAPGAQSAPAPAPSKAAQPSKAPATEAAPARRGPSTKPEGIPKFSPSRSGKAGPFDLPLQQKPVVFPEVPDEGIMVTFSARQMDVREFLENIQAFTGWTVVATEKVTGIVTAWFNELPVSKALKVLELGGFYYEFDQEQRLLLVMTREEYLKREYGELQRRDFQIRYADISDMELIAQNLLSADGQLISEPRTGRLMIIDNKQNLEYIEAVIRMLDVDTSPKIIQLSYVSANDVADKVEMLLSEKGLVQTDQKSNKIIVFDQPERMEKIAKLIEELDQKPEAATYQVNYAKVTDIVSRVQELVPSGTGKVQADERTGQITVFASPTKLQEVRELLALWDRKEDQVMINAYIMRINASNNKNLGVDWRQLGNVPDGKAFDFQNSGTPLVSIGSFGGASAANVAGAPVGVALPGTAQGKMDARLLKGTDFAAVINFLASDDDTQVLARPQILVTDGDEATFQVTTGEPYQEGGFSTQADTIVSNFINFRVQFLSVGTTLTVKPRINRERNIEMEIDAEDSNAVERTILSGNLQSTVPVVTTNKAKTKVLIHEGETLAVGGLRRKSDVETVQKLPFLGDVPLIGLAFKSTTHTVQDQELVVFLTPNIVTEYTSSNSHRLHEFSDSLTQDIEEMKKPYFEKNDETPPFKTSDF